MQSAPHRSMRQCGFQPNPLSAQHNFEYRTPEATSFNACRTGEMGNHFYFEFRPFHTHSNYFIFSFMIILALLLLGVLACYDSDKEVSTSLATGERASVCFNIDKNRPVVLRLLAQKARSQSTSQKTHRHHSADDDDEEDEVNANFGRAQVTYNNNECQLFDFGETCYFSSDELSDKELRFKFECTQGPCDANIQLFQPDPKDLELEGYDFTLDSVKLFHVQIPAQPIQRYVVEFKADNKFIKQVFPGFFGYEPFVYQTDTKLIAVYTPSKECNNKACQSAIVLSSDEKIEFKVSCQVYQELTALELNKNYFDKSGKRNTYKFSVEGSYDHLIFQIKGDSPQRVMLSYDKQLKYTDWDITLGGQNSEIIIKEKVSTVFVEISKSADLDDFVFTFMLRKVNANIANILVGNFEVGLLQEKETQHFLLKVEKSKQLIEIDLESLEGEASMGFEECNPKSCEPIANLNLLESHEAFVPGCKRSDDSNKCWYAVAVTANSKSSRYSLRVRSKESSILLQSNAPYADELNVEEKQYFVYNLEKAESIKSLIFRVSSPNVVMFISRKCKIVNWDCKQYSGTSDIPIIFQGKKLKMGAYYITVEGIEFSSYTITAEIQENQRQSVIELGNGKTYQSTITTAMPRQCYKFSHAQKSLITASIHGPSSRLVLFVNQDDSLPSESDYDEKSIGGPIQLISEKITACVEATDYGLTNANDGQIGFSIVVYDEDAIISLDFNQPQYGTIVLTQKQRFNFFCNLDEDYIYITKNALSLGVDIEDLQVYIGDNPYDSASEYEIKFVNHHSSTFVLDTDRLKTICSSETKAAKQDSVWSCEVYLLIMTSSLNPLRYMITVHKRDLAMEVKEGHTYKYNLEHVSDPDKEKGEGFMHFYFKPANQKQTINMFASSFFGKLSLAIKLWKYSDTLHKSEWPFPTPEEDDSDYISGHTNQLHRAINASALEACWPNCLLLVSVKHHDPQEIKEYADMLSNQIRYDDQFSLLITQVFHEVIEGQKLELSMQDEEVKYLIFRNLDRMREDDSLVISMMSILGNGYCSITINGKDNLTIPSINGNMDFHSDGGHLQIKKSEIVQKLEAKQIPISEAYLLIAVGGFISYFQRESPNQTFKIEFSISFLRIDIFQIYHAVPHEFRVEVGSPVFIYFYNYQRTDIKMRVHRTSGYGDFQVWPCPSPNLLDSCIEETSNVNLTSTFLSVGSANSQLLIKKTQEHYCAFCQYLVKITSKDAEMNGQLTVMFEGDYVKILPGSQFEDNLEKKSTQFYTLQVSENQELQILIKVINGNPTAYLSDVQGGHNISRGYQKDEQGLIYIFTIPNQIRAESQGDSFYKSFIHDEFYLRIDSGDKMANYSITYTVGEVSGNLQDGRIHTLILSQAIPKAIFIYENYDSQVQPILSLAPLNGTNLNDIAITINYIKKTSKDDYRFSQKEENRTLEPKTSHQLMRTYSLPYSLGIFEILIKNLKVIPEQSKHLDSYLQDRAAIELSVSGKDIKILSLGRQINDMLPGGSDYVNYYEVLVPKNGFLILEVSVCQSEIFVAYGTDLMTLLDEKYDQVVIKESQYEKIEISANQGTLYFSVHNFQKKDAYYQLNSYFYTSKKSVPFGKLIAGQNGAIKWELDKRRVDWLKIEFAPIECLKCDKDVNFQVDYEIFIAQDKPHLNMFGFCGFSQYEQRTDSKDVIQKEPIQSYKLKNLNGPIIYEIKFPDLVTYEFAQVGILAKVNNFMGQNLVMKVPYVVTEVPVPNYLAKVLHRNQSFFTTIMVGMILLIILLTLYLCYYMRKLRQTAQRLEQDTSHGRKVVGLYSLPQNDDAAFKNDIKMRYDNLEDDN